MQHMLIELVLLYDEYRWHTVKVVAAIVYNKWVQLAEIYYVMVLKQTHKHQTKFLANCKLYGHTHVLFTLNGMDVRNYD